MFLLHFCFIKERFCDWIRNGKDSWMSKYRKRNSLKVCSFCSQPTHITAGFKYLKNLIICSIVTALWKFQPKNFQFWDKILANCVSEKEMRDSILAEPSLWLRREKPKPTCYVTSVLVSAACEWSDAVCESMWSGVGCVASGRSAAPPHSAKLAETRRDEMSCLFTEVSLRGLTLFSLLPLCIRLLITPIDPPAPAHCLCVFKTHKHDVTAPLCVLLQGYQVINRYQWKVHFSNCECGPFPI